MRRARKVALVVVVELLLAPKQILKIVINVKVEKTLEDSLDLIQANFLAHNLNFH